MKFGKEYMYDVFDAINELQIYLRQLSSHSYEVTHLSWQKKKYDLMYPLSLLEGINTVNVHVLVK